MSTETNTETNTEAQDYLEKLRRELAGLPAAEIEEIVQDLEPQVAAIAAEPSSATLAERLGDPVAYARELRNALGMPDEPTPWRPPPWLPRMTLAILAVTTVAAAVAGNLVGRVSGNDPRHALVFACFALCTSWLAVGLHPSTVREIAALPEVRLVTARLADLPVTRYLTSVRPGWFVVRGVLVWLGAVWFCRWCGWHGPAAGVVMVPVAVLAVVVGHRAMTDRKWLWLSVPLTGWAVGVALKATELLPTLATGDHLWP